MKMDKHKTKVIFRILENHVIALFPELHDYLNPISIESYMHVGQHGEASPEHIKGLQHATPEEYKDLFEELQSIGYNLLVVQE